jgi:carbon storage regulator
MLVLSRRVGERIKIGDNITIVVTSIRQGIARIGIEAPKEVVIVREEIIPDGPAAVAQGSVPVDA